MLIGFFIGIVLLITLVIFAINPITRAINNAIVKHNEAVEKRRQKEEQVKELEELHKQIGELTEKLQEELKLEEELEEKLRKQSAERFYNQSSVSTNRYDPIRTIGQDDYDWVNEQQAFRTSRRRRIGDWEIW